MFFYLTSWNLAISLFSLPQQAFFGRYTNIAYVHIKLKFIVDCYI